MFRRPAIFILMSVAGLSACFAMVASLRWPLVGDASLIHYVVFLMEKGWQPYREIKDINLPGSYFFDALAMRFLGGSAIGWRLWDLFLLAVLGAAVFVIAGRTRRLAAFLTISLFILVHLGDGIAQAGQRDLVIAALLALSYAALFTVQRGRSSRLLFFSASFAIGATLTIKPLFWPLGVLLFWLSYRPIRQGGLRFNEQIAYGMSGLALPPCCVVWWLARNHTLRAFWKARKLRTALRV